MFTAAHTTNATPSLSDGFRRGQGLGGERGDSHTGLPSGWWLVPSILGGALIWGYGIVAIFGLFS